MGPWWTWISNLAVQAENLTHSLSLLCLFRSGVSQSHPWRNKCWLSMQVCKWIFQVLSSELKKKRSVWSRAADRDFSLPRWWVTSLRENGINPWASENSFLVDTNSECLVVDLAYWKPSFRGPWWFLFVPVPLILIFTLLGTITIISPTGTFEDIIFFYQGRIC